MKKRTEKEDQRARELIRQEVKQGIDTLTDNDFHFREKYWRRPLTEMELEVMRKRLTE